MSTLRKTGFWFALVLIVAIGLYPYLYLFVDWPFGILMTKSEVLLQDTFWRIGFFIHIILGSIALLAGWSQFIKSWRSRHLGFHRNLGKIYTLACWLSGTGGLYIGFFATGGWIAKTGFIGLALVWLVTTSASYLAIRKKKIDEHHKWMVYSYSACLAAVTLRIWLPCLQGLFGDFFIAYQIVAWWCWVPNLIVAHILLRKP